MAGDDIGLKDFIEELVENLGKRLNEQDKEIKRLKRELASLRAGMKRVPAIDRSVLKILRGRR